MNSEPTILLGREDGTLDPGSWALDLAHQVALDAAILERVNEGQAPPCWRFWEVAKPGIVLGTGGFVRREVFLDKTRADGVPVVRRMSGGGTVVQAPGVLNYSVVLRIAEADGEQNITGSYRHVLEVVCSALQDLGVGTRFEPPSDLAVTEESPETGGDPQGGHLGPESFDAGHGKRDSGRKKISGNAQARKRRAVLVHGTVLVSADTGLFARYLKHPPKEPSYRQGRSHGSFVTTLHELGKPVSCREVAARVARRAGLDPQGAQAPTADDLRTARHWARTRYAREEWNLRK